MAALFLILSLLSLSADVLTQESLPGCVMETKIEPFYTFFHMNGQPLPTSSMIITIKEESAEECEINTTNLVEQMKLPPTTIEMIVAFQCNQQRDVYFTPYTGKQYKYVLFHVEVANCTMDIRKLDYLLDVADTRVITTILSIFRRFDNKHNNTINGIRSAVAFSFDIVKGQFQDLYDIFDANYSYPEMAEIQFGGMEFTSIPDTFESMFPNLQSLEIARNKLILPPSTFPWIQSTVLLPRNFSRSQLMQSHYTGFDYVAILSNLFRRYFTLDRNQIEDLSNFSFHGFIHKISLKDNGLKFLGNDTFKYTSGLQNLDLSNNQITVLPADVFRGLTSLRKLDLSGNKIERLNSGMFNDLSSLITLNIANNSLTYIEAGTFSYLYQLEFLRLEYNLLHEVVSTAFPLDTINLKEIHLQNNPLETLPNFPFWIRGLQLANFQSTNITFDNFTRYLANIDTIKVLHSVVDTASDSDVSDLLKRAKTLRKIDLTNSSVTQISLSPNLPWILNRTLLVILTHFEIILKDNPIICDCNINTFSAFIKVYVANGTLSTDDYYYKDWVCKFPSELAGRKMLQVLPAETYCPVVVEGCPSECECYKRSTIDNIIVDCRDRELKSMHETLPSNATLELWYSGNNITKLMSIPSAENVIYLDVSFNRIEVINGELIRKMTSLKEVHLQANVLAYLPPELSKLPLTNVSVWPNPLTCDCKSLWLKRFLEKNMYIVNRWHEVSCKVELEEGMLIREVDDGKFVCQTQEFDELRYVVMPAIVCSTIIVILLIGAFVFYAYRLECKVLLFVYFGIHPFDNDSEDKNENLDCVIVHSGQETDWVMDQIVELLENENYHFIVCDMARDFVVGFSFQENLTRTVRHSKRMIFCLSQDWNTSSESFTMAWRIAQEKIKETKSHYGIIVSHELKLQEINDKDLKRFIKRGRFVDSKDKLFKNKVLYYMPQTSLVMTDADKQPVDREVHYRKKSEYVSRCFINSYCEDNDKINRIGSNDNLEDEVFEQASNRAPKCHAFISYHESDLQYVLHDLVPRLEEKGFTYCIADRDFVPGAAIEENILNAIDMCHRTIFVLSPANSENEWSLFTFRAAYEKALREKSNYLLVIIKEDLQNMNIDEEIKHYLKNYICLNVNDRWFEKKLFNGLPLVKNREELHSSPLFITSDEIDVKLDIEEA